MTDFFYDNLFLFKGLNPFQKSLLRPLFKPCECFSGEEIFEQGKAAEYLYIVVSGEVEIRFKPEDGPELIVSRINSGGVFGWSSALGNKVYTSSAVCVHDNKLIRVRGEDLKRLCEQHPDTGILILEHLATVIAERLHNMHSQVVSLLKQGMKTA